MIKRYPNVWRRDIHGYRYPCLCLQIDWPADPDPLPKKGLMVRAVLRQVLDIPDTSINTATVPDRDESMNFLLLRLARHLETACRTTHEETQQLMEACVRKQSIEYPFLDEHSSLTVVQVALQYLVDTLWHDTVQAIDENGIRTDLLAMADKAGALLTNDNALKLLELARGKRIAIRRMNANFSGYLLGYGRRQKRFWWNASQNTSYIGSVIATNKTVANGMLAAHGLPVPAQRTVASLEGAKRAASEIGFPVVIKPQKTDRGTAVSAGITSDDQLEEAFSVAKAYGQVIVEKHIPGYDHRVLILGGKALWTAKRIPAHIIGDGTNTVSELIKQARKRRLLDPLVRGFKFPDQDDSLVRNLLARQSIGLDDTPAQGRTVLLRTNANVSTGGTVEFIHDVHPDNLRLAERAAAVVGLDIAGVDLLMENVSQSWRTVPCGICEINPNPAMAHPDDPEHLLEYLAGDSDLRIPVLLVVGDLDASRRLCRQVMEFVRQQGRQVSVAIGGMVFQDHGAITRAGLTASKARYVALYDKETDVAVICMSPGEVLSSGVDIDYVDLALFLSQGHDDDITASCVAAVEDVASHILVNAGDAQLKEHLSLLLAD